MLENCNNKQERFARVQQLINEWLAERQELVVSYHSLCNIDEPKEDCQRTIQSLKVFCQVLVDYISAGHFEVYNLLAEEDEAFGSANLNVLEDALPNITMTTDLALAFQETYDTDEHCIEAISRLKQELSTVGEAITHRFSLEDKLIEVLHSSHADVIASQPT